MNLKLENRKLPENPYKEKKRVFIRICQYIMFNVFGSHNIKLYCNNNGIYKGKIIWMKVYWKKSEKI